jgi:hypothetical protein
VKPDLAGPEQFAAAQDAKPLGQVLGVVDVVAAPSDMDTPDFAVAEAEAVRAGDQ